MNIRNVEFKARVEDPDRLERQLQTLGPRFVGTDRQRDTYFRVAAGRLKLREGNIENSLISYERADTAGIKASDILLYRHTPDPSLKEILCHHLGVRTVVDKERNIYFIGNVKFHFDRVKGLGTFVEVEAIDEKGAFSQEQLRGQCDRYLEFFGLDASCLVDRSYSDLLEEQDNGL